MANKGPYVNISGVMKHAKKLYVNISGTMRQAVSTYIKVGGVWKETKVALNSNMVIGADSSPSSLGYGFDLGYYGSMSSPTLGWDTVMRSLYALKDTANARTRVTLNLSSGSLPQSFTATRNIFLTFIASNGNSITCTVSNSADNGPFNYWQVRDGAESLAIYNWLLARNGQAITVRGALA